MLVLLIRIWEAAAAVVVVVAAVVMTTEVHDRTVVHAVLQAAPTADVSSVVSRDTEPENVVKVVGVTTITHRQDVIHTIKDADMAEVVMTEGMEDQEVELLTMTHADTMTTVMAVTVDAEDMVVHQEVTEMTTHHQDAVDMEAMTTTVAHLLQWAEVWVAEWVWVVE
ncbi:hypothetical protein BCR33DRAFT_529526 [Rhizoclosmatium globosum]|uniref:Uncharacterized protein n=1 Tax=Rhizoclosmatium globosum TaxID=329046 RepID=A0A1Y2CVS0_9FUNG|nr:hypothetical protein BCR33DRAFT_529526 [Rhizoclosmatium globosum]|eukprot:ORY50435.1 hypothetical protein BCR33DRAFT_529526 [Rhizoclosmatium globosum]